MSLLCFFASTSFSIGFVAALPQASVTLWEFEPVLGSVIGTEWAEPIGTASDGSVTTFVLADVVTLTGLTLVGSETVTSTATVTGIGEYLLL